MELDLYKLYYHPLNASMAPRFVLEALGLKHELVLVDRKANFQKSDEYLALNPSGRIPVLVAGNNVIFESAAICIYLCEKNPGSNLIPQGVEERAQFFQWLMYLTSTVQAELMVYFYPDRHSEDAGAASLIQRQQDRRVVEMLSLLDSQLEGKQFLLSDNLSLCDYFLFMLCVWADELSVPPLKFKNLNRHLKYIAALPEVSNVCRHENLSLEMYA
jgi:glutathione S-transferase